MLLSNGDFMNEISAKFNEESTETFDLDTPMVTILNPDQMELFSGLSEDVILTLSPTKLRVIYLYLAGGYTYKQIASLVGVTTTTVKNWLMLPEVQTIVGEIQTRELALVKANINAMTNKALETMMDLMDSNMDNVRYQAARDLLDRAGLKAAQNIKVNKTVTTLEQQIADLAEYSISDEDVIDIDIDDILSEVKDGS